MRLAGSGVWPAPSPSAPGSAAQVVLRCSDAHVVRARHCLLATCKSPSPASQVRELGLAPAFGLVQSGHASEDRPPRAPPTLEP